MNRNEFIEQNNRERLEQIRLHARRIRETGFSEELRKAQAEFLDAQFEMSEKFYIRLIEDETNIPKFMKLTGFSEKQARRFRKLHHC